MEGLLGWTTPFIWTMPGLLLVAFPVPFPPGLPAEGLLVAALPLTAFLRDIFQDFKSIFMTPAPASSQSRLNDLGTNLCEKWAEKLRQRSSIWLILPPARWKHVPELALVAVRAASCSWQTCKPQHCALGRQKWCGRKLHLERKAVRTEASVLYLHVKTHSKLWLHRWLLYLVTSAGLEKTTKKQAVSRAKTAHGFAFRAMCVCVWWAILNLLQLCCFSNTRSDHLFHLWIPSTLYHLHYCMPLTFWPPADESDATSHWDEYNEV